MEEEFYATLKLTSNEELLAKVCYLTEEECLLVEKPLLVIRATQKKSGRLVEGFSLSDWVMSSYEELYVIKMEQVVTITEMDKKIKGFYTNHLSREDDDTPTDKMSKEMGYLGSVTDQKSKLEDLFNRS
jgi:formate dehydrogenase assembly factor FdhD